MEAAAAAAALQATGACGVSRPVLDAHCKHGRPLEDQQSMRRFVNAALTHLAEDDTCVLRSLGDPDSSGCQRLREICQGTISIEASLSRPYMHTFVVRTPTHKINLSIQCRSVFCVVPPLPPSQSSHHAGSVHHQITWAHHQITLAVMQASQGQAYVSVPDGICRPCATRSRCPSRGSSAHCSRSSRRRSYSTPPCTSLSTRCTLSLVRARDLAALKTSNLSNQQHGAAAKPLCQLMYFYQKRTSSLVEMAVVQRGPAHDARYVRLA